MRRIAAVVGLSALLSAPLPAFAAERVHRYEVTVAPDLTTLQVRACFEGALPGRLIAPASTAVAAFRAGWIESGHTPLHPDGPVLRLPAGMADACVRYDVELIEDAAPAMFSGAVTRRVGPDLRTEVGLWLWRPVASGDAAPIDITFRLPPGIAVSAPWPPRAAASGPPTYRIGPDAAQRPASVAFGGFEEIAVTVPGATLRVAVLGGLEPRKRDDLIRWVDDAARSVAAVYGRFPVQDVQVLVLPGAGGTEPTPNAYVLRGGAGAVHFSVNARRPLREFVDDWTAAHELSHLFLPFVVSGDAWLYEGVATYYQHLSRARSGAVSPEETWRRMHAAFLRGGDIAANSRTTLTQASRRMVRDGYMRVYNAGAAILLLGDVALRERTAGAQSLDTVLERFGACCLDPEPEWTARQVLERFDAISGTDVFVTLYDRHVDATGFPDLGALYARLGIETLGAKVVLNDHAPLRDIRYAILAPGTYRTPPELMRRPRLRRRGGV
ncbi:MAG: hypothetical protein KIT73_00025 [Burkholderiales bacterium]|nr:hypothetical protein [Burkholderiales bacterium]